MTLPAVDQGDGLRRPYQAGLEMRASVSVLDIVLPHALRDQLHSRSITSRWTLLSQFSWIMTAAVAPWA